MTMTEIEKKKENSYKLFLVRGVFRSICLKISTIGWVSGSKSDSSQEKVMLHSWFRNWTWN